jgi:amidohydrolase
MYQRIRRLSEQFAPRLVRLRRHLHQYPELALSEYKTAKTIAGELKRIGLGVTTGQYKTSVVGLLQGAYPGKTAAVRADMDALPITEQTNLPFRSRYQGRMHACGHDVNMATVVGAAAILSKLRENMRGNVKFIFQPSEEVHPGGAKFLIEAGVLERPRVGAVFGIHVYTTIPTGQIGVRLGPAMAQSDDFDLTISGVAGHGSSPQEGIDALVCATHVVQALQTISSRRVDPVEPVVVSIGSIHGGEARNVICDRVELKGTVRTLNPKTARRMPKLMSEVIDGVCRSFNAKFKLDYFTGYPILRNNPRVVEIIRSAVSELYSPKAVVEIEHPVMGGEDFAYFLQKVPGAQVCLGARNERIGADKPWHSPQFIADEEAIPIGAATLAAAAWEYLERVR